MTRFDSRVALALALGALAACSSSKGGGGPTNPGNPGNGTQITSGVVVDPYLEGAVLQELTLPARKLVQESSITGATGQFSFGLPLTQGNVVVLSVKGLHNGVPYTVRLERLVDVTSGAFVVSPLTTLLAAGRTPAQVLASLDPALAGSLTAADLTADPMARAQGGLDARSRQLLAASIAVGGALQLVGGNVASADLGPAANAIGGRVLEALRQTTDVDAGASAGAAVADYIAKSATPATVGGVASGLDASFITSLVQTATQTGEPVGVVGDGSGGVVVSVNPGTVGSHLGKGRTALETALSSGSADQFLTAANEYSAAATLAGSDTTATANDRDQARFFGGLARLALLAQPYSDGTDNGLNDLGDILDAFGMSTARADRATMDPSLVLTCQQSVYYAPPYGVVGTSETCKLRPIATTSPRSGKLQAFLSGQVKAALRQVVDLLSGVSATFTAQLTDGTRVVDFDRTDALALKGFAQGMIALIELQQAYDLDVDLHAEQVRAETTSYKPGQFLANNPTFLKLVEAASVPQSRTDAIAAIDSFIAALASLRAETGSQVNDLFKLTDETCTYNGYYYACTPVYNGPQQLADAENALTTLKGIATATGNYTVSGQTGSAADDLVLSPSKFFAGVDLRALLPARFDLGPSADHPGMLPDATFAGVVVHWPAGRSPNTDLDGDGLPDYLGGYTRFGPWLQGNVLWMSGGNIQFAQSGTSFTGAVNYPYATYSGTYAYTADTLTLTYAGGTGPQGAARSELKALRFWDGGFSGQLTRFRADNSIISQTSGDWTIYLSVGQSASLLHAP